MTQYVYPLKNWMETSEIINEVRDFWVFNIPVEILNQLIEIEMSSLYLVVIIRKETAVFIILISDLFNSL